MGTMPGRILPEGAFHQASIPEAIYGVIAIMALIVYLEDHPPSPWSTVGTVLAGTIALAVAKTYATALFDILSKRGEARRAALLEEWRSAMPLLLYPQVTTLVFVACALGLLSLDLAFSVAEVVGSLSLFVAGQEMARRLGLPRSRRLLSGLAIGAVGVLIVSVKVVVKIVV
jgi:hypothetical protein